MGCSQNGTFWPGGPGKRAKSEKFQVLKNGKKVENAILEKKKKKKKKRKRKRNKIFLLRKNSFDFTQKDSAFGGPRTSDARGGD